MGILDHWPCKTMSDFWEYKYIIYQYLELTESGSWAAPARAAGAAPLSKLPSQYK